VHGSRTRCSASWTSKIEIPPLIITTEIQLARDLGEVLREAYGGETDYDYREGTLEVS
jgi:hypothetical protein